MGLQINTDQIPTGMTRREIAILSGLAKTGSRGRMSKEAVDFLKKVEDAGYEFAESVKPKSTAPAINTSDVDFNAAREWLQANGHEVSEMGRIANAALAIYVEANPNYPKRTKNRLSNTDPMPKYDPKIVRAWAIENDLPIPARGRLSRELVQQWVDAGGNYVEPPPVEAKPKAEKVATSKDDSNNYSPEAPEINHQPWWQCKDFDGSVIRLSKRDVPANSPYSLSHSPRPCYAWSKVRPSEMTENELEPVI